MFVLTQLAEFESDLSQLLLSSRKLKEFFFSTKNIVRTFPHHLFIYHRI